MRQLLALALFAATSVTPAWAGDAPQCQKVRISDLGWTDIMLTNSTAEVLLDAVGYDATQTLLGLDVTFVSLKNNEMDVFLGNWLPAQDQPVQAYFDDGSVEVLGTNLEGAKVTLAVPKYVSDAGIKSFDDLAAHADKFGKKIFSHRARLQPAAARYGRRQPSWPRRLGDRRVERGRNAHPGEEMRAGEIMDCLSRLGAASDESRL